MKRQVQMLLFVVFAMMLLASAVSAARDKHGTDNLSMNDNDEAPGDDCATHFQISSDDRAVARGEEERTLDPATFKTLTLDPGHNGGVLLRGWDQPNVKVKVCKAGIGANDAEAKDALSSLRVEVGTGSVRAVERNATATMIVTMSGYRRAWVQLIVQVPANISTEMTTWNGPLSTQRKRLGERTHKWPHQLQTFFRHVDGRGAQRSHRSKRLERQADPERAEWSARY